MNNFEKIKAEIKNAFLNQYNGGDFEKFKKCLQKYLIELHQQELIPEYKVKTHKLPRKLKKQYKKEKKIFPLDIVETIKIESLEFEIEVK